MHKAKPGTICHGPEGQPVRGLCIRQREIVTDTNKNLGKAEYVFSVFQRIARGYDSANARISLGREGVWKRQLVRAILRHTGERGRVLDLCCGTGDIALRLARERPGLKVKGVDFSPAMLEVAERKRARQGFGNVRFLCGDALSLPFPDGYFSAAAISFGLRNTRDAEAVLREMLRVTKKGGRIYCLDSFVPDSRIVRPFYRLYFRFVMPLLGGGLSMRQEYLWLCQSTEQFFRKGELADLFRRLGCRKVRMRSWMFGSCALVVGTT